MSVRSLLKALLPPSALPSLGHSHGCLCPESPHQSAPGKGSSAAVHRHVPLTQETLPGCNEPPTLCHNQRCADTGDPMTGTDMAMWLPKTAATEKPTSINTAGKEGRKGEGRASKHRDTQNITHKERPHTLKTRKFLQFSQVTLLWSFRPQSLQSLWTGDNNQICKMERSRQDLRS